jgi:hypothetical protein
VKEEFMDKAEDEARRLFTTATEDMPAGTDLLTGVRSRRARNRRRTQAAAAALSVAIAGAVAFGAVTASGGPASGGPASGGQAALTAFTTAATQTAATSYQVTIISTVNGLALMRHTVTGAFDPARGIGEENDGQIRYIGDDVYINLRGVQVLGGLGEGWLVIKRSGNLPAAADFLGAGPLTSERLSPQDLLTLLRTVTTVRETGPASGPGWTGTGYAFSGRQAFGDSSTLSVALNGTAGVDREGRVRQLDVTAEMLYRGTPGSRASVTSDITFGDFGIRVSVTAPPASQVISPQMFVQRIRDHAAGTR